MLVMMNDDDDAADGDAGDGADGGCDYDDDDE